MLNKIIKSAPTSKNIVHRMSTADNVLSPHTDNSTHYESNNIHYLLPNTMPFNQHQSFFKLMHNVSHAYPSSFTKSINHENKPFKLEDLDYIPYDKSVPNARLLSGEHLYRKVHGLVANHLLNTNPDLRVLGDYAQENPNKFKDLVPNIHELDSPDAARSILTNFLHNNYMKFISNSKPTSGLPGIYGEPNRTLPDKSIVNPKTFATHLLNESKNNPHLHPFIAPALENLKNSEHIPHEDKQGRIYYAYGNENF